MMLLLITLCVVLIIVFLIKERRLSERIDHLENLIKDFKDEFQERVSQATSGPPESETMAPPTKPLPSEQIVTTPEPSFPYTQSLDDDEAIPSPEETELEFLEEPTLPGEEESISSSESQSVEPGQAKITPHTPSPFYEKWQSFKGTVDWEQFTGVKLFAWLGGLALFIAAGFFVKFSIDRNLIPPALRLAISAVIGIFLILGAGRFSDLKYRVMRHTLAAAGIGVLYSVVFAATLYYEYLSKPVGFGLLAVISAAAFVLAVFYKSIAVSILGALGAYATPILVSTGQGSLVMLFGYLVIVNIGLYQVARRLASQVLLLVAVAGTVATLGLGTWQTFWETNATIQAVIWILNLILFALFLGHSNVDPKDNKRARWTGTFLLFTALDMAVILLMKPGWSCLLMVTTTLAAAMGLAWRNKGWYRYVIPYSAISFLISLVWVLFVFEPTQFSIGFLLLLLYGAFGGLGPLVLVWRYGLNRAGLFWFRAFPLAIVLISLTVVFKQPAVSFWFWPLLLGLELIGIGISVLFRAVIQVGLLLLLFVIGGIYWLFHVPDEMLGIGFFLFIMGAGIIICIGLFLLIKRLPHLMSLLQLNSEEPDLQMPVAVMPQMAQWLSAAPAAGVCLLLAASFLIPFPHYPNPGMLTLVCFLALILYAVRRLGFEISGIAALLGAVAAQSIFVFHPVLGPPVFFSALLWSGILFLLGLFVPFILFQPFDQWRRIWNGWAIYEAAQAVFVIYVSHEFWPAQYAQWVPLILAVLKLPLVAILLARLEGRQERNVILAFHGGALLFYISTLPVLVLDHGWIGLTFVMEAAALLWLNRRIEHQGLRWVALAMAPLGLIILTINIPLLKTSDSLPVLNSATLTVSAAVAALIAASRLADFPRRLLNAIDLPNYFLWLTVATGFLLINLVIADLFAQPGSRFAVWPGRNFLQWSCYALSWVGLGGLLWRLTELPGAIRMVGLGMLSAGTLGMIVLPMVLPEAATGMHPLLNIGLAVYLPLLVVLYFLFHIETWEEHRSYIKNIFLALFLAAGFIAMKLQLGIFFATGYPFSLFLAHTPAMAAASAAGWMAYGLGIHVWPKRLDPPFRLAGLVLIIIALIKALSLPFLFRNDFARMIPLINPPTLVYLFCLASLIFLTLKKWDRNWPLSSLKPRAFWGIIFAIVTFCVLNIEIASVFAIKGRPFSMMTHGSLAMQLAYSIGWLLFAIGLLIVGIRWQEAKVRWASIAAIVITACKIFIMDVSSLGQLYRVASLFGLAVVLILVSFLYQRFLSEGKSHAK